MSHGECYTSSRVIWSRGGIIKIWWPKEAGRHIYTLRRRRVNSWAHSQANAKTMQTSTQMHQQTHAQHISTYICSHKHQPSFSFKHSSASQSDPVSVHFKCHSSVYFFPVTAGKLRNGQSKQMKQSFNPQFSETETDTERSGGVYSQVKDKWNKFISEPWQCGRWWQPEKCTHTHTQTHTHRDTHTHTHSHTHTHPSYTHPTQPPTHTQHVWVREKEDRQFM